MVFAVFLTDDMPVTNRLDSPVLVSVLLNFLAVSNGYWLQGVMLALGWCESVVVLMNYSLHQPMPL